ncbi:enhancer of mRNA-decapping protein 3-like [Plakobranchus ocellatus]|uniref:Enhancer of mRNA-decapping protein 3 n=1 Tax=Plakobranchus ocellatus TaxID=259542 RepID=A0AAV4AMC0_9GAST|nr:enhancer of mRNA-decapping protein 3-like [Plakobranchus ocellatus]
MVSIDCGPLGTYQGRVQKIDPVMNTLTITHAFMNGLKCDQPELNLSSTTIRDIKIIHASHEATEIIARKATPSKMTKEIDDVTKPTCTSPIKIIKATSKARTGFSTSNPTTGMFSKEGEYTSSTTIHGKGSCRRKLSPPDSPSRYLDRGNSHQRQRISNSANRELLVSEGPEQGNGHAHRTDLAPSDFHLFGPLGGKKFEDEDELIGEVRDLFSKLDANFFKRYILASPTVAKMHSSTRGLHGKVANKFIFPMCSRCSPKFKDSPSGALAVPQTNRSGRKMSVPKKMERGGKKTSINSKNNECFSAPTESYLQEFDFESNLALFNKKAVFQEIENGFPELSLGRAPSEPKYRHDENVLQPGESNTVLLKKQQIQVPGTIKQVYSTDCGLLVPAITLELRDKLCELASEHGISSTRQLESFSRSASEMVIHLIGGSHRIHPKNDHQMPTIVVLCGAHDHGALGACCARILSSHGVQVTLVTPNCPMPSEAAQEIELFKLTGSAIVHNTKGLPKTVDLIVSALDSPSAPTFNEQPWYQNIIAWTKSNDVKAQVLALDPPTHGPGMAAR